MVKELKCKEKQPMETPSICIITVPRAQVARNDPCYPGTVHPLGNGNLRPIIHGFITTAFFFFIKSPGVHHKINERKYCRFQNCKGSKNRSFYFTIQDTNHFNGFLTENGPSAKALFLKSVHIKTPLWWRSPIVDLAVWPCTGLSTPLGHIFLICKMKGLY